MFFLPVKLVTNINVISDNNDNILLLDFAEALVSLGKTQHSIGLLADSLESLSHAVAIRTKHYGEYYPQVCNMQINTVTISYTHTIFIK